MTKKILKYGLQALIALLVFYGASKWQARNLLPEKEQAPALTLKDTAGKVTTVDFNSADFTVLYFFSSWCPVCGFTNSGLSDIASSSDPLKIRVYGIALSWNSIGEIKKYAEEQNISFPVLAGDLSAQKNYRINKFPTIYIIKRGGGINNRLVGYTSGTGLKLRTLLSGTGD